MAEPTTPESIQAWIDDHLAEADLFADVAAATAAHRTEHGCDAFESGNGPMLGALARAARPSRALEVGTALGYGALWLAYGAGPSASVETIERDPVHADLAREQFATHSMANVSVLVGNDLEVLAQVEPGVDFIFYDASVPTPEHLALFDRLLSDQGAILTSNLFLGRYAPELPGLEAGARYREALFNDRWLTAFVSGKALSTRR